MISMVGMPFSMAHTTGPAMYGKPLPVPTEDDEVRPRFEHLLEAMHGLAGQTLAEQHHVRPQHAVAAVRAVGRDRQPGVVVHVAGAAAVDAAQPAQGAVHLDDVARAGGQVKAIHVLGEHGDAAVERLEPGDGKVPGAGMGAAAARFDLGKVVPGCPRRANIALESACSMGRPMSVRAPSYNPPTPR